MKKVLDRLAIIYIVIAILLTLVYWLAQGNLNFITIFSLTVFIMIPGIAALSATVSLRESGRTLRSKYFRTWLYYSLGTFAWFTAEAIWIIYAVILKIEIPYPSLADIFYMVGNLSFLAGLGVYFNTFAKPFLQIKHLKTMLPLLFVIGGFSSYYCLSLSPLLAQEGTFKETVDLLSIFSDSAMIIFAILSFIIFKGQEKVGTVYSMLSPGMILWALGDLLFTRSDLLGTYYNGAPLELLYLFNYLMISQAFIIHKREF